MSPSKAPPSGPSAATNGTSSQPQHQPSSSSTTTPKVGPHPGHITSSNQYTSESTLRRHLRANNTTLTSPSSSNVNSSTGGANATQSADPSPREDTYRLQGVQLIDNVRLLLQLPLRTFDTACVYYHRFRLSFRDAEYAYQDAALASLFVACKVEDTIKKSRDILAASYNVKNPDKPAAPDDKVSLPCGVALCLFPISTVC